MRRGFVVSLAAALVCAGGPARAEERGELREGHGFAQAERVEGPNTPVVTQRGEGKGRTEAEMKELLVEAKRPLSAA